MKKWIGFSIIMLFALLSLAQAQTRSVTVFADDFESYAAGTFPSSGGWYLRYNGAGNSYQVVVNSQSHSGAQSMQLKGAPNWTAQIEKAVDVQRDVIFWQAWVLPTGNDGGLGLLNSSIPTTGNYGVVYFDFGKIYCQVGYELNVEIGDFTANQWYKVKVKYDHIAKCIDVWINDVQKVSQLQATNIYNGYYNTFYLFSEHDGNLYYFDDIEVWYDEGTPVELSAFTAESGDGFIALKWTTHSETENYGFHIYRSQSKDGGYQQITRSLIPGAGMSNQAHQYSFVDREVAVGTTYYYKLADIDFSGNVKLHGPIAATIEALPIDYSLEQNYPNPFNPTTTIGFSMKESGHVSLKIYDLNGKLVRTLVDGFKTADAYRLSWNGTDHNGQKVATGNYIYVLKAGQFEQHRKMTFIK